MIAITIAVGAAMLLFGRRLFWLFVAGIGFVVGALFAAELFRAADDWVVLAAALVAGIVGALLAMFAQKVAIGLAGFLAGGYLGHALAVGFKHPASAWIAFVIGGVVGAILLVALFNWALIALSSLAGAAVIAQHCGVAEPWPAVIFLGLLVAGVIVQTRQLRGKSREAPAPAQGT